MMQFDEFVAQLEAALRPTAVTHATNRATWANADRTAAVALVPPLNVSVTLTGSGTPDTTWYPVDAALVPVVSNRVAMFLARSGS